MDEKKKKSKKRREKINSYIMAIGIICNIYNIIAESNFTAAVAMFFGVYIGLIIPIEFAKFLFDKNDSEV